MRILIAPDCYGDSLTAVEAAEAIAHGWRRGRPDDDLTPAPARQSGQCARRGRAVTPDSGSGARSQVTLDGATLREAGIAAAFSITDHAGSVQLAIEDAANQLEGLAQVTAATWG